MNQKEVIRKTAAYAKRKLENESSGHDWWHTYRVWKMAKRLAKEEKVDMFIVELAALLHDIEDWKHHDGDESVGKRVVKKWLKTLKVDEISINRICAAIENAVFRGGGEDMQIKSREGAILFDADQLDGMGAVGIARGFMFAGNFRLSMYDPDKKPLKNMSEKQYKNFRRKEYTQVNHFYEKILLLKDLMSTGTAKKIASRRHKFLEKYLDRFFKEWDGND